MFLLSGFLLLSRFLTLIPQTYMHGSLVWRQTLAEGTISFKITVHSIQLSANLHSPNIHWNPEAAWPWFRCCGDTKKNKTISGLWRLRPESACLSSQFLAETLNTLLNISNNNTFRTLSPRCEPGRHFTNSISDAHDNSGRYVLSRFYRWCNWVPANKLRFKPSFLHDVLLQCQLHFTFLWNGVR